MYTKRAETVPYGQTNHDQGIFKSRDKVEKKGALKVDARGDLVNDLSMVSLVDRHLFYDTFFLYYSATR
jgi:hypothetical protein